MASSDTYRASIRAAIRGLWSNRLTAGEFAAAMQSAINRGLTQAWLIGAKDCSKNVNDLTVEERARLALFIVEQQSFVQKLGDDIMSADKERGVNPLLVRADMWAAKWEVVRAAAEAMCKGDAKKKWILGPTREKCKSCLGFANRTYRASTWLENEAMPGTRRLQCHGYRCQCRLMETTDPVTKGRFPKGLLV